MSDWSNLLDAYAEAGAWFVKTAGLVGDRWSAAGLGQWDVRALVGHTARSLLTVETGLANPPRELTLTSPVAYFQATRTLTSGAAVAQRGRDAGDALGLDPAAAAAGILARVLPLLDPLDGTELVATAGGGMRIADYLPTRVFELVVHTADLAVAIGVPADPPAGPATRTLALISQLAIADGHAATVLLAFTGRHGLPSGFSVL